MTASRYEAAKRHLIAVSLAVAGASSAAGCGGAEPAASGPSAPPPSSTAAAVNLAGHWQSDCLGPQNGNFSRLTFDITADAWKLDYDTFGDAACTTALGTVHIEGPYRIEGPSAAVSGASEATFSFAKRTVTPRAQGFVDFLRSPAGCGRSDFTLGAATDILEKGCPALGAHPQASCPSDHDVVRRDANELRFGQRPADNDMCTKEKRPTSLSSTVLRAR